MKIRISIALGLVVLSQLSCGTDGTSNSRLNSFLVMSDSLVINLPDTIPHLGSVARPLYSTTNSSFSYIIEEGSNVNIYTFLKDSMRWNITELAKNGPNQVYSNGAFNLFKDEILFLPYNAPKILRVNKKGLKVWERTYYESRDMAVDSKVKSPIIHDDGTNIFFNLGSYVSFNDPRTFEKTQVVGRYDYRKDEFQSIINFPEEFHNNTWSGNDVEHQMVIREDLIYMNFVKSEYVYVYDKGGSLIMKQAVKSERIKNSQGKKSQNSLQDAIDQASNGFYPKMMYDQWRDVFYRVGVYYDVNYTISSVEDVGNALRKKKIVIITFDKDLNVIAHDEFDAMANRLNEYYQWVNEDGLYLYQIPVISTESEYQFAKFTLTALPAD